MHIKGILSRCLNWLNVQDKHEQINKGVLICFCVLQSRVLIKYSTEARLEPKPNLNAHALRYSYGGKQSIY